MNNQTIRTVIILVVVLTIIGLSTFFIGRYLGKKSEADENKGKTPDTTDWGKSLTKEESEAAQNHAKALYNDMKGWFMATHNPDVYTDYLATSDRVFVATANYFKDNYGDGENLAQWVDGEHFFWSDFYKTSEVVAKIIKRLEKFGIIV